MARPRSDIAPRILAAARARFLVEGVDGASLRAIAREAGTSIGMVYYYFPTKDDLFLAVVEQAYGTMLDDVTRALAPDAPVQERLSRLYARFASLSDEEVDTVRMLVREALVSSKRLDRVVQRFSQGHIPLVLATLAEGIGKGELSSQHPPVLMMLATMTLGLAPQIVGRMAGERLPVFAELRDGKTLAHALVRLLLDGLSPRPPGG